MLCVWTGGEVDRLRPEMTSKIGGAAERLSPVERQQVSLCHLAPNLERVVLRGHVKASEDA